MSSQLCRLAMAIVALSTLTESAALNRSPFLHGPVLPGNFPDPCLAFANGYWYTFATSTEEQERQINIQIARSRDYQEWELVYNDDGSPRDALYYRPSWANQTMPNTWAPDVVRMDDGSWVMYFAATTLADPSKHCVGAATADDILGPYHPLNSTLACGLELGGAIDPAGFKDWGLKGAGWGNLTDQTEGWTRWWSGGTQDPATWEANDSWGPFPQYAEGGSPGQRYVVYKVDGNSVGGGLCSAHPNRTIAPTPIILQPVKNDGVTLDGAASTLLDNAGVSDDGVVEAPSLVKGPQGQYVLFFSSGCYSTPNYTVSYATASSVKGPYARRAQPLLKTGDMGLFAPGGADVNWNGRQVVLHAGLGMNATTRQLYVGVLSIDGDTVTI